MDVVYVLGKGSEWDDRELYYSLRSVRLNLRGWDKIFVVGDVPRCPVYGVEIISASDESQDKQQNVRAKLLAAIHSELVSDAFVLMNDDFFIAREMDARCIPYYSPGNLTAHYEWRKEWDRTPYAAAMNNTISALRRSGLTTRDFELHAPIIYHKQELFSVLDDFEFDWSCRDGLLIRSLYGNKVGVAGVPLDDCKIEEPLPAQEISRRLERRDFFSIGPGACGPVMGRFLEKLFPAS